MSRDQRDFFGLFGLFSAHRNSGPFPGCRGCLKCDRQSVETVCFILFIEACRGRKDGRGRKESSVDEWTGCLEADGHESPPPHTVVPGPFGSFANSFAITLPGPVHAFPPSTSGHDSASGTRFLFPGMYNTFSQYCDRYVAACTSQVLNSFMTTLSIDVYFTLSHVDW